MSEYQTGGDGKNIGNVAAWASGGVSSLLNDLRLYENLNTYVGKDAGINNTAGLCNTVLGYQALWQAKLGSGNLVAGHRAGAFVEGSHNVLLGTSAAQGGVNASVNVAIGSSALELDQFATCNVAVGFSAGQSARCDGSVLIGMCNSATAPADGGGVPDQTCYNSVSVGALGLTRGYNNVGVGHGSTATGRACTAVGFRASSAGACNVAIGPGVACTARGSLVAGGAGLRNDGNGCLVLRAPSLPPLHNTEDGYLNIQDCITRRSGVLSLVGSRLELRSAQGTALSLDDADCTIRPRSMLVVEAGARFDGHVALGASLAVAGQADFGAPLRLMRGAAAYWTVDLDMRPDYAGAAADLVFRSRNNTLCTFTDDFVPDVLNFTGKHRCRAAEGCPPLAPGMVVVATGRYCNLDDQERVDIDEAIPVVDVAREARDARAFGVVSAVEADGAATRSYHVGNIAFTMDRKSARVVVNSVGEGAILVCDANGPVRNGDLLVTSPVPGHAMRQGDGAYTAATVAKATCDADFAPGSGSTALIGCTYKF